MSNKPFANVDLGVVVEPMADIVTARLRIKRGIPRANEVQLTSEPGAPLANVDLGAAVEPTTDVVPALGVVVEPMADIVTARLRFRVGIPLGARLAKVGAP